MRLYIIRHAEPAYPADKLSPRGHLQAQALAEALAEEKIVRLFSSPMTRALETARYTADRTGLEIGVEDWMAELESWALPDRALGEIPAWEVDPVSVRSWSRPRRADWSGLPKLASHALADGFEKLCANSDAFLSRLGCHRWGKVYEIDGEAGAAAAFCHCGLALTWLAHLLEIPVPLIWAGFTLPASSVTVVDFQPATERGSVPRCTRLGGVDHLEGRSARDRWSSMS